MTNVLIVSLGTSPEPIINCITSLRPDRVVFLCSLETQKLIDSIHRKVPLPDFNPDRDVVVLQQRLGNKQSETVTNELDQLDRVYLRVLELFERVRNENHSCRIVADYTGGTKTMTTGLAMAAIDDGDVRLHLTVGDRSRGQSALSSYSSPVAISTAAIHARRLRERELPALLRRHDYEAARQAVRRIQSLVDQDPDTTAWLKWLETLLVSLDAWDRFDHRRALEVLDGLNDRCLDQRLLFPLKRVIGSRRLLDQEAEEQRWPQVKGHGLEAVEDLLLNAERRAQQQRYDDAVGRLYRALELTAQLLLVLDHDGIRTADVDLAKLPPSLQEPYAAKRIERQGKLRLQLALRDSFELLSELENPVGLQWSEKKNALMDALQVRNNSLFAHGFRPVTYSDWLQLDAVIGDFLRAVVEQRRGRLDPVQQFPSTLAQLDTESRTSC